MGARDQIGTGEVQGRDVFWSVLVVTVMASANLAAHVLRWNTLWLGPLLVVVLFLCARSQGLGRPELGLGRDRFRAGVLWGAAGAAVIGGTYLAAALTPLTRPAFLDERYDFTVPSALVSAFVVIPLGTVVPEEIAFRSVLWGSLTRLLPERGVLLATSALFGLWHVYPATGYAAHNEGVGAAADLAGSQASLAVVVGTVLVTGLGGLLLGWLRQRSGSVVASMGVHWAINGLGVLVGLLARALGP